jgi:hypothetical protein
MQQLQRRELLQFRLSEAGLQECHVGAKACSGSVTRQRRALEASQGDLWLHREMASRCQNKVPPASLASDLLVFLKG